MTGADPFALDDAAPTLPNRSAVAKAKALESLKAAADQRDIDRQRDKVDRVQRTADVPVEGSKKGGGMEGSGRSITSADLVITPDLKWTPAMRRVYVALTSATWRGKSLKALARLAKVSERRFRTLRAHPAIVEMLRTETLAQLRDSSTTWADAVVSNMRLEGREGSKDRELFARAAGMLPAGRVDHTVAGKVQHEHTVAGSLTDAIRRARAARAARQQAPDPQDVGIGQDVIDVTPDA